MYDDDEDLDQPNALKSLLDLYDVMRVRWQKENPGVHIPTRQEFVEKMNRGETVTWQTPEPPTKAPPVKKASKKGQPVKAYQELSQVRLDELFYSFEQMPESSMVKGINQDSSCRRINNLRKKVSDNMTPPPQDPVVKNLARYDFARLGQELCHSPEGRAVQQNLVEQQLHLKSQDFLLLEIMSVLYDFSVKQLEQDFSAPKLESYLQQYGLVHGEQNTSVFLGQGAFVPLRASGYTGAVKPETKARASLDYQALLDYLAEHLHPDTWAYLQLSQVERYLVQLLYQPQHSLQYDAQAQQINYSYFLDLPILHLLVEIYGQREEHL